MSVETSELMMIEGNDGDMNEVEVCVVLNDLQSGLMRELVYTLSVDLETAGEDHTLYITITITLLLYILFCS